MVGGCIDPIHESFGIDMNSEWNAFRRTDPQICYFPKSFGKSIGGGYRGHFSIGCETLNVGNSDFVHDGGTFIWMSVTACARQSQKIGGPECKSGGLGDLEHLIYDLESGARDKHHRGRMGYGEPGHVVGSDPSVPESYSVVIVCLVGRERYRLSIGSEYIQPRIAGDGATFGLHSCTNLMATERILATWFPAIYPNVAGRRIVQFESA